MKNTTILTITAACALLLSGCGGGGGSSALTSEQALLLPGVAEALGRTALNGPKGGSVTQTSNGDGDMTNPTTTDSIQVSVSYADGMLQYRATKTAADGTTITISSTDDTVLELFRYSINREESGRGIDSGIELFKRLPEGRLWVDIYTNSTITISGDTVTEDTDYLAGGIWVYVPDSTTSPTSLADYEYGAFIDGNQPFTLSVEDITGTATYSGSATGVYADPDAQRNYFFDAAVTLNAAFDTTDNAPLGTIYGTMSDFVEDDTVDNPIPIPGNPMLMLSSAGSPAIITAANNGFFTGDTSSTYEGEDYTGKWGGQFYGNPPANPATAADAQPGSVAGTFGGTTTNREDGPSFVGVFGALKQ